MGYVRHHAIIVTAWDEKHLTPAHELATNLGLPVSNIVPSWINGYASFLIAPDGSKEGWTESNQGDEARQNWLSWAKATKAESSIWFDWVLIEYGGDDSSAVIQETS